MLKCIKCGKLLPDSEFSPAELKSGHHCKKCKSLTNKLYAERHKVVLKGSKPGVFAYIRKGSYTIMGKGTFHTDDEDAFYEEWGRRLEW